MEQAGNDQRAQGIVDERVERGNPELRNGLDPDIVAKLTNIAPWGLKGGCFGGLETGPAAMREGEITDLPKGPAHLEGGGALGQQFGDGEAGGGFSIGEAIDPGFRPKSLDEGVGLTDLKADDSLFSRIGDLADGVKKMAGFDHDVDGPTPL